MSTNRYLLDRAEPAAQRDGAVIRQRSFVADDAVIDGSVIGPYAAIGAGAVVRNAVVQDAIIDDGAVIENAVIDHSVVGRNARVIGRPVVVNAADQSLVKV